VDFNAIAATMKESVKVEITHPTTGEGGWFIEVATQCNHKAQAAARDILDKSKSARNQTWAQKDRANAEFLAAFTLGWTGLTKDGEEDEYTHEKCVAIYLHPKADWVRGPVSAAIGDPSLPFSS